VTIGDELDAVRVAAVGDLHVRSRTRGLLRPQFASLPENADLLLLAGDLTNRGALSQAHTLCDEIAELGVPIVAVLGNHDHDEGQESQIRALLSGFGVHVLDCTSALIEVRGMRVGVAGTMGYDGGFGNDFDLWHAVRVDKRSDRKLTEAQRFGRALADLREVHRADLRIALTHYSPVRGTLEGEPREIIACLGNELLGRTIDQAGADLAVHGHAHFGTERGRTVSGIEVRNVARPVLGRPYAIYTLVPERGRQANRGGAAVPGQATGPGAPSAAACAVPGGPGAAASTRPGVPAPAQSTAVRRP
jgi:Icc-related predicted phosphoesterase